jgi:hypothetical protein
LDGACYRNTTSAREKPIRPSASAVVTKLRRQRVSEQKRDRDAAYAIVYQALDLAQELSVLSELRDPKNLRKGLSKKELKKLLKSNHRLNVANTKSAYELLNKIGDWADEYPIKGEQK